MISTMSLYLVQGGEKGVVTYANDALGTDELNQLILNGTLGVTLAISLEVAKVTDVADLSGTITVRGPVRVDYEGRMSSQHSTPTKIHSSKHRQGAERLTVRASGCAAVGVVTEGVDMHATLGVGIVAGDVPANGGQGVLGLLLEGDGALDVGVTTNDSNYPSPNSSAMVRQLAATQQQATRAQGISPEATSQPLHAGI